MIFARVASKYKAKRTQVFHRTAAQLLDTSKRIMKADNLRRVTTLGNYDKVASLKQSRCLRYGDEYCIWRSAWHTPDRRFTQSNVCSPTRYFCVACAWFFCRLSCCLAWTMIDASLASHQYSSDTQKVSLAYPYRTNPSWWDALTRVPPAYLVMYTNL